MSKAAELHAQLIRERFFRDRSVPESVFVEKLTKPSDLLSLLLRLTEEEVESGQPVEQVVASISKNICLRSPEEVDDFRVWEIAVRNRYGKYLTKQPI